MTDKQQQKMDFEEAIRAVKGDEPDAEAVSQASGRLAMLLQRETGKVDGNAGLHGCADIQRTMPQYLAGQLSAERTLVINTHLLECVACRRYANGESAVESVDWSVPRVAQGPRRPVRFRFALALSAACMALVAFFGYSTYFAVPAGARARVESLDGDAYRMTASGSTQKAAVGDELADGEVLRTAAGAHVYLKLQDGSRIETRERSELAVNARGRNLTVALDQGAVIVQAAHRKSGHLYVRTPDARVAVTGTIFSVNAGIKGSRVAVMEGTVEVAHAGVENTLHAGDQVATSDNMRLGSMEQEVAWSRDRGKYLALISQFAALQSRLAKVQMPALRYNSDLLDRVPSSAVLYISIPNLGEVLGQSNEILQEQLRVSPELRQWFGKGNKGHEDLSSTVATIQAVSQYLGNEIVIAGFEGGHHPGIAALADVGRSGFAEYLKTQFPAKPGSHGLRVLEPRDLASFKSAAREEPIALVRANEVVFANNVDTLRMMNAQLDAGASGMSSTDFGRQIGSAYDRGAGFFLAANMSRMLHEARNRSERGDRMLDQTGIGDLRYILAEHREMNGAPENHLDIEFEGQRHGIASWLAAPAPMGSLDFISANAALSVSVVAKEPREIVDDMLQFATGDNQKVERDWDELQNHLQVRLKDDLAAQLGGDVAFALDGPVLPTPSWKFVLEIHDSARLQDTLQRIVQSISNEMRQHGGAGLSITSEDVEGRRFYRVQENSGRSSVDYTFDDGYMIVAANRAIVMSALKTHAGGDSLARSSSFRSLLPKDENLDYSGIAYQNLSPVLRPLLSQLQGEQAKTLQQFAADARPTVVCVWGRDNRIEAASNSRLLGLDLFTFFTMLDFENKASTNGVQRK